MPGTGPRAKHWCFTLNNYTPSDLDRLSTPIDDVDYLIYGKEVSSTGTPHLQGFVSFQSRKRLQQVISLIGQCHCSVTRSISGSIEYCKKDGDYTEVGLPPSRLPKDKESENEMEAFKQSVKEGVTNMKDLREMHSSICASYPRFVVEYIEDHEPPPETSRYELKDWQSELYRKLILPPDPREIIFIVDIIGNKGKTWFSHYYCDLHENAQIIIPGKKADMAHTIRSGMKVFFLDCPRSKQGEFIQYDFLEELKNGRIFSPKYESRVKKFKIPHVVVFMNERPCMDKLSEDRYSVTVLSS